MTKYLENIGYNEKGVEQSPQVVSKELAGQITEVYVDVLILVNFVMDFFIIWAAGKLANVRFRIVRIVFASVLGAVYSLIVFFPDVTYLNTLLGKVFFSFIMIITAFAPLTIRSFFRSLVYFYLVSFAMGGAVIGAVYLTDELPLSVQVLSGVPSVLRDFNIAWLLVGLGVAVILGLGGIVFLRRSWLQQQLLKKLVIHFIDKKVTVQALLDTGNQLMDPLTNKPVIVVEFGCLKDILPENISRSILENDDISLLDFNEHVGSEWAARLRLIPYNSVGRSHGMLLGVKPDLVEIISKEGIIKTNDVVIGILNRTLNQEGKFQALLHPAVLQD